MAAYSERHYGEHTWRLRHPHVIVEHFAEAGTAAAVYNTFAPDVADPELHELPNVCAHFVVSSSGRIFQLVNLRTRCRHTVGLNWTAIGIEHTGFSDADVLGDRRQLHASLLLTRYLRCRFHIRLRRRDRPRREPQLALPPRGRPEPAQPDPRRLEPQLDADLPAQAEQNGWLLMPHRDAHLNLVESSRQAFRARPRRADRSRRGLALRRRALDRTR